MVPAIEVGGLSKKYQLRHEVQRYRSLREELMAIGSWMLPSSGRSIRAGKPKFEEFWALRGVSFEVCPGDRLAVIGRNGAGKSTLLKILSRITEPTSGRVAINGRVSSLLEVGTGFHPELTGRENIFLNGAILGMRSQEVRQKFDQIVDFAEVERFLDTPVKRYSSGMYVRLAFAVAAHLEPDVLIVDEVLAVGDVQFQQKCLGRMSELSQSGRTILFVTHNMDAVQALCTRGIVLGSGQKLFEGSAQEASAFYLGQVESIEFSLDRNSGRGGSGGVGIRKVEVLGDGILNSPISVGGTVTLRLCAMVGEELMGRPDLEVAFGIDTVHGQRLFTVISSWHGFEVDSSAGQISTCCEIPSLPVVPGRYLVSVAVIFRGDTLESVEHCAAFDVVPVDREVHVQRASNWGALDLPCRFLPGAINE